MSVFSRLSSTWRTLFRKSRLEHDLDEELRAVVETLVDRHTAQGMSEESARRAARVMLGGVEPIKDAIRDVRAGGQIEVMLCDIRYGLRTPTEATAFTAAARLRARSRPARPRDRESTPCASLSFPAIPSRSSAWTQRLAVCSLPTTTRTWIVRTRRDP